MRDSRLFEKAETVDQARLPHLAMQLHKFTPTELLKAIGIGIGTALLLSAVMVPALRLGILPLPKPLGLAFAETVLGSPLAINDALAGLGPA